MNLIDSSLRRRRGSKSQNFAFEDDYNLVKSTAYLQKEDTHNFLLVCLVSLNFGNKISPS